MTDEGGTIEQPLEEAGQKKFSGKKLILFVILPLILLILTAVGLYVSGILDSLLGEAPAEEIEEPPPAPEQVLFFDLPDMLVNLNTGGRRPTFLKISVSLQVGNDEALMKLEEVRPRIIDNFQVYLRELRIDDLQGSAGMYRLREELLYRVNAAAHPVSIKDVLFREMLIQ